MRVDRRRRRATSDPNPPLGPGVLRSMRLLRNRANIAGMIFHVNPSGDRLARRLAADPLQEGSDVQVVRPHVAQRRQRPAQHVVDAVPGPGALEGQHVRRLLDHAQEPGVAPRVAAHVAQLVLGQVEAARARAHPLAQLEEGGRQCGDLLGAHLQQVQRQAQRWTFLGSGMTHPNFLKTVDSIMPGAAAQIEKAAAGFC